MHCSFLTFAFSHFNLHVTRTTFFQPVHLSVSSLPPPSKLCPSACRNSSSNCCKSPSHCNLILSATFLQLSQEDERLLLCADFHYCTLILAHEDLDYMSFCYNNAVASNYNVQTCIQIFPSLCYARCYTYTFFFFLI